MSKRDTIRMIRDACRLMDVELHTADHFVCNCIRWLAGREETSIYVSEQGYWDIRGGSFFNSDDDLTTALAGAVLAWQEARGWDSASDEALENFEEEL